MRRASKRHHFSAWALLALAGAACSESVGTDELDHTAGVYIHANHPMYWSGSDHGTFIDVTTLVGWTHGVAPAGSDDLAQRWLQYWTDRIDDIVRAKVEADTGKELVAPKPIMHLLPSPNTANAWVTGVPACIPWQVRPSEGSGDEETKYEASSPLLFNQFGQNVHELGGSEEAFPCLPRDDFEPFADFFVREWNKSAPSCPAKLASDGVIEVAEPCMGDFASASRSAIYTTSNHVQFASDLLASGTEAGAVFVVAHELAHYYRAHVSPLTKHEYGFWYDQDARTARKPLPAKDQAELEALYKEVEALPGILQAELPGARHSKRYQRLLVRELCDYVYMRSQEGGLPEECATTNTLCEATAGLTVTSIPIESELEAYLSLEDEIELCGAVERIGAVETAPVSHLILALQAQSYLPGGPPESVPLPQSFGALMTMLEQRAAEHDATLAKFAEKMRLGRIGLYTTEQEADDLALEWVNLLGFSTDEAIGGWLTYLDYFAQGYTAPGELSVAECRSLYESSFKQGRAFVTVSLGDLQSAHHSGCYRVYNLWREQRAHKYVPAAELKRPDFTTWSDVLTHATELSQPAW
jgi:hypothetical protein